MDANEQPEIRVGLTPQEIQIALWALGQASGRLDQIEAEDAAVMSGRCLNLSVKLHNAS